MLAGDAKKELMIGGITVEPPPEGTGVTVTVVWAVVVPTELVAVRIYVMVEDGETKTLEPV